MTTNLSTEEQQLRNNLENTHEAIFKIMQQMDDLRKQTRKLYDSVGKQLNDHIYDHCKHIWAYYPESCEPCCHSIEICNICHLRKDTRDYP